MRHREIQIGGPDQLVIADHTFNCFKAKYDRGKFKFKNPKERGQSIGFIEVDSGVVILDYVCNQSGIQCVCHFFFAVSFMFTRRVLPKTLIWTDEGNSFNDLVKLEGYEYSHETVCHAGKLDLKNAVLRRLVFEVFIVGITVL